MGGLSVLGFRGLIGSVGIELRLKGVSLRLAFEGSFKDSMRVAGALEVLL